MVFTSGKSICNERFYTKKRSATVQMAKPASQIVLTTGQVAWWSALNEAPIIHTC